MHDCLRFAADLELLRRGRAYELVKALNLISVLETHSERQVFSAVHGSVPDVYPCSSPTTGHWDPTARNRRDGVVQAR